MLKDLARIDDEHKEKVGLDLGGGKTNMINFKKYIRLADRIKSIKIYQTQGYDDIRDDWLIQKILLNQFDNLKTINQDDLWNVSNTVGANDKVEAKKKYI